MKASQVVRRAVALCLLLLSLWEGVASVTSAPGKKPRPEVMGIRLGMVKEEAHKRLKKLGSLEREERKRQEIWAVTDRRVSHLLVGFDTDLRVRYITAIARPGGPRIRYDQVADTRAARDTVAGDHHRFTWEVAARPGQPAFTMSAQGRHPQYLDSYSVKKTGEEID